ncbi:hypothetical protein ACX80W_14865 [Arthrobacter sp. TMN-37]
MTPREPNESTDDAVWRDLVARLESTPGAPEPSGSDDPEPSDRDRVEAIFRNQPLRPAGPRDYEEPEDEEDPEGGAGYVPPDPPPLGVGDPLVVLAWLGAAGGPVLLLLFAMFWRDAPTPVTLGLLGAFLAGVVFLVLRLPRQRDYGDDGAEV